MSAGQLNRDVTTYSRNGEQTSTLAIYLSQMQSMLLIPHSSVGVYDR